MLRRLLISMLIISLLATTSAGVALGLESIQDDEEDSNLDTINRTITDTTTDATTNTTLGGLTASTCDVDRDTNQVTCPVPPACEDDADCHLPDACTLQPTALVCSLDHETSTPEPYCRPSTEDNALVECAIPPQCDDRIGERGCAIPPSCTVREDRIYCNPPAPQDGEEDALRHDCRPLNDTALACSPPDECLDDENTLFDTQACSLPSTCEPTRQDHYRCPLQATQSDETQDREDDEIVPRLHEHIRKHFETYRANVYEAQQAHLDHKETLQERFNDAKDDLREAYTACLDSTPEAAGDAERHEHQRSCLEDARENLAQQRTVLLEEHREHRESLRDDLETARQETCRSLKGTLQGTLEEAGIPKHGLHRVLTPSQMPLCSSLFLDILPYDEPVQSIENTEAVIS